MAHKKQLRRAWLWLRIREVRAKRWWWKQDRRFGLYWRIGNGAAAVLILVSIVIPVLQYIAFNNSYRLSAEALQLVGKTNPALVKQLGFDQQTQSFTFNQSAIKDESGTTNPFSSMQTQLGTASGQGSDKSLYALTVAHDFAKGVTYNDVNTGLSFSLVPQFTASPGKVVDNHLVYPIGGGTQAVYTLKGNGLKEDIVVTKAKTDTMTFRYHLDLPDTLQAKIIPNSGGNIGIYGADPTLYGNISYGSDSDRAAVANARKNGTKDHLVFGLPSPVIKDLQGNIVGQSHFALDGTQLSVVASGLASQKLPVSIDPSVVVTSTSDFQTNGNAEDNIDFSTSGQISRNGLKGGSLGSWTASGNALNTARYQHVTLTYNGYIYVLGGTVSGGTQTNTVEYATINSNGTIGTWGTTTVFTTGRASFAAVAYNGYMYVMGGQSGGNTLYSDVQVAAINSGTGAVGTWGSPQASGCSINCGNTLPSSVFGQAAVAAGGYLYSIGGCTSISSGNCGSSPTASSYQAVVNADGTLGSWSAITTTNLTGRYQHAAVVANNYLYVLGGCTAVSGGSCTTTPNDVQYASINPLTGAVSSWKTASTTFATGRTNIEATVIGNYLYVIGGSLTTDIQYAPIYANGSVGNWTATTAFGTARTTSGLASYGNTVYLVGGCSNSNSNCSSGIQTDTQYAAVNSAGVLASWTTTGTGQNSSGAGNYDTVANALSWPAVAAYNGFIYIVSGNKSSGNAVTTAILKAPINNNGTLGTWSTATQGLNTGRYGAGIAIYNGYMYVSGGQNAGGYQSTVEYAPIASSGDITTAFTVTSGAQNFTNARAFLQSTVYNGFLYIMGGRNTNNTTNLADIQYIAVNSNGTLGASWSTATQSLPTATSAFGFAVSGNGYFYLLGGGGAAGNNQTVYSKFDASGDVTTAFTTLSGASSFTGNRWGAAAWISKGYLYVAGGTSSLTYSSDVEYTKLGSNGAPGTWATTSILSGSNAARYAAQPAVYGGYTYLVGGCITQATGTFNCSVVSGKTLNDVQYVNMNNGGGGVATASTWTTNSTDMTNGGTGGFSTGFAYGASFVSGGYIYSVGGYDGSNRLSSVWSAPLNGDGSVGSWTQQASMSSARSAFVLTVSNGYVYVYTGINSGGSDVNTYEYAKINANGGLGSWTSDATMNLSSGSVPARSFAAGAAYNGYLYLLGGNHSTTYYNDVAYAQVSGNGSVGTWHYTHASTDDGATFSAGFTTARYQHAAFAYDGYIYIVGGTNSSGSYLNDTQYAVLNSNGTVGSWAPSSMLVQPRALTNLSFADGYVYLYAGTNTAGGLTDIEQAPIQAGGGLGQWEKSASSAFTNARTNSSGVVANGYVYMLGGFKSSPATYYTDVQYSPLNLMAVSAHYSKLIDLGSTVNVTSITYNGQVPGDGPSVLYKAAGSNASFSSSGQASSLSGSGGCNGSAPSTRYLWVFVTLDDTYGQGLNGAFADANGTNAYLTDVTVNYSTTHVAPQVRLRGGASLQNGSLTALDTCGA